MATKRRHSRKRKNPVPAQFTPNPRRRRRARRNPSSMRPRVSTVKKYSYFTASRQRRRHNPSDSGTGVSVGKKGSIVDGVLALSAGAGGYFGGMLVNQVAGTKFLKFRGIVLAIASLFGIWKIKDKTARMAFVGVGVEGIVDALRQNVATFAKLSADDAAETLILGQTEIGYNRGVPQLGNEDGLGNEEGLGDDESGMYGEEEYENEPPEGYTRALIGASNW